MSAVLEEEAVTRVTCEYSAVLFNSKSTSTTIESESSWHATSHGNEQFSIVMKPAFIAEPSSEFDKLIVENLICRIACIGAAPTLQCCFLRA